MGEHGGLAVEIDIAWVSVKIELMVVLNSQ